MSILIKGMEMPKNCNECKFGTWSNLHQTAACKRHDFEPCFKDHSREYMEKRADFCPLVDVPAPHGRLIDYGWVVENVIKKLGIKDKQYLLQAEKALMILVDEAPTVIEAEEGEDE